MPTPRTLLQLPPLRRVALIAALATVLTLLAYAAAYLSNVRPGGVPDTFSTGVASARRGAAEPIVIVGQREPRYRWGGPYSERLFLFANQLDRRLRPGTWTETFTFTPLPPREPKPQ